MSKQTSNGCSYEGCEYSSKQKSHLTAHERRHIGEKPFACNHEGCDYSAKQKLDLTKHERIHTGEKPFACSHEGCGFRAAVGSNITQHCKHRHGGVGYWMKDEYGTRGPSLVPSEVKSYECSHERCDYSAKVKGSVTKHERTHTGEKPFACSHKGCKYRSAWSSDVTAHCKNHHKGEGGWIKDDGTMQKKKRSRSRMSAGSTDDSAVLPRSNKRQKVQQGATAPSTVAVNTNPPAPMRR